MSDAAATSPFSLTFTVPKPETPQGVQQAFRNAALIGDQISFFWNWADQNQLPALVYDVKIAQAMGLKVAINMSMNNVPGISTPAGYSPTFANIATDQKYISDVAALASLHPTYLNIYAEVNILAQYSSTEFSNYQNVYPLAYQFAKAVSPTTLVGASFLDVLWIAYHEQALPDQLGPHDFIGITSFPFNHFPNVAAIPAAWYSQWRVAYPTEKLLVTEVAFSSAPPFGEDDQAAFVAALPSLMAPLSSPLVAYSVQYDGPLFNTGALGPAQVDFFNNIITTDAGELFNNFNNCGLFNADGNPKPAWYTAIDVADQFTQGSTGAVTIDTTPAPPPSVPDLAAASDSGVSNTDNLANNSFYTAGAYSLVASEVLPGVINGDDGPNVLTGTAANDTIDGLGGNDTISGRQGNDTINGGTGFNTAVYLGNSKNYTVTFSAGTSTISVQDRSEAEGTDTLTGIQELQAQDGTLDTAWFTKTASLPLSQLTHLAEIYIASFNRAPDALGLAFWGAQLSDGMPLTSIAASFFVQPEAVAAYPAGQPTQTFVNTVYGNVLGRQADTGGLGYWASQIDSGTVGKSTFLLALINGAIGADLTYLANKVAVGEHFALAQGLSDPAWGRTVMAGVGGTTASVTAANALTDGFAATAATTAGAELVVKILGIVA